MNNANDPYIAHPFNPYFGDLVMIKHFILNLNPQAQFDWERCVLHHPITAEQPDLAQLLASDLGLPESNNAPAGSYLISVKIEVAILESTQPETTAAIAGILPRSLDRLDHLRSFAEVA
jgi:hypothetical protein